MSGGDKKKKETGPPINATSKEEEKFIQYVTQLSKLTFLLNVVLAKHEGENRDFLKNANLEEQKAKH